jgi:CHASE2 domain-containing sensor protein
MVSHILSTVLDNRPLIWSLSELDEAIWIFCWSLTGGLLIWLKRSCVEIILYSSTALIILYGTCWVLLVIKAAWLPLVPTGLAFAATSGCLIIYRFFL